MAPQKEENRWDGIYLRNLECIEERVGVGLWAYKYVYCVIRPILQMKRLRLGKVKKLAESYTAGN